CQQERHSPLLFGCRLDDRKRWLTNSLCPTDAPRAPGSWSWGPGNFFLPSHFSLLTPRLYASIMKVKTVEGGDDNGAERDRGSGRWVHARSAPPEPLDEVREGPALCERGPSPHRKEVRLLGSPHEPLRVGDPLHESPLPRGGRGRCEELRRDGDGVMTTYRPGYIAGKVKMSVYVAPEVHR